MEQRDYILKEIEKISILIAGLLGRLRRIETRKQFEEERGMINNDLTLATGLTINDLIALDQNELINHLAGTIGMNHQNLEQMAVLLVAFSANSIPEDRYKLLKRAEVLLQYINTESKTFSFERATLLDDIHRLIAEGD